MNEQSASVLGVELSAMNMEEAVKRVTQLAQSGVSGYVCFVDAHMMVEAHDGARARGALDGALLRLPDGAPVAWSLWLRNRRARRISGPCATLEILKAAEAMSIPVGFYGGTAATLTALSVELRRLYPDLLVPYLHSPPFRAQSVEECQADYDAIRESGARLLFVGLGCPKQEIWMHQCAGEVSCIMLGVGAAFGVIAGETRLPPRWIQGFGLTWVLRFIQEPRRLWRRVFYHLPRFIWLAVVERFRSREVEAREEP